MAKAKTVKGSQLLIKVGDGAGTETFSHPCLINSTRGLVATAATTERAVPDCDDPELLQWLEREKNGLSGSISGAGVLHASNYGDYFAWLQSKDTKNVEVTLNVSAANGGGKVAGAFHLTNLEISGDNGDFVTVSLDFLSSGQLVWTAAS